MLRQTRVLGGKRVERMVSIKRGICEYVGYQKGTNKGMEVVVVVVVRGVDVLIEESGVAGSDTKARGKVQIYRS